MIVTLAARTVKQSSMIVANTDDFVYFCDKNHKTHLKPPPSQCQINRSIAAHPHSSSRPSAQRPRGPSAQRRSSSPQLHEVRLRCPRTLHHICLLFHVVCSGFGDSCTVFSAAACDGAAANESRPFLFNLVGNMQQRPWRQRLRASLMNSSLPAASLPASSSAAAAAAAEAMQLTEHVLALPGTPQHFAVVCVFLARLLPHKHPPAVSPCRS
jgi:hypothetical protein